MNLQELLNKNNIKCDINIILDMWNESHRSYHNLNHLNDIMNQINKDKPKYTQEEYEKLILTALFHDCVYDPKRTDNEEKSAEFLMNCALDKDDDFINDVKKMIIDTKTHKASNSLSSFFIKYDMNIVERDFESLLEWEKGIAKEYKMYKDKYKKNRIKFLKSLLKEYSSNKENILKLINWVKKNY